VPAASHLHASKLRRDALGFAVNDSRQQVAGELLAACAALLGDAVKPGCKVVWDLD